MMVQSITARDEDQDESFMRFEEEDIHGDQALGPSSMPANNTPVKNNNFTTAGLSQRGSVSM